MANKDIGNQIGVVERQGTATASEIQTLDTAATEGTFTLRFGDQVTSELTFDDSAADIQTALRALSNISASGVTCAGGPLATSPVTVTFGAEYAAVDVPLLIVGTTATPLDEELTVETTTPMVSGAFDDDDMDTIAAMRARLTTISGTTYTTARLNKMTKNDMMYALRHHDNPQTI